MSLVSRISDTVKDATEEAASLMTRALRQEAVSSGWPKEAAMSLVVEEKDGSLSWYGNTQAYDMEYGTLDQPPNAVVRRFLNGGSPDALVGKAIQKRLQDRGIL